MTFHNQNDKIKKKHVINFVRETDTAKEERETKEIIPQQIVSVMANNIFE